MKEIYWFSINSNLLFNYSSLIIYALTTKSGLFTRRDCCGDEDVAYEAVVNYRE